MKLMRKTSWRTEQRQDGEPSASGAEGSLGRIGFVKTLDAGARARNEHRERSLESRLGQCDVAGRACVLHNRALRVQRCQCSNQCFARENRRVALPGVVGGGGRLDSSRSAEEWRSGGVRRGRGVATWQCG